MLNELSLFTGAGGGLLGSHLLGWKTVCGVEVDDFARRVLFARQRDGLLPRFPIWDNIKTFNGKPWRDRVDIISGGFPCQDISTAGKGKGLSGERSGLVFEMLRIVEEIQPQFVFAENSPLLRTRGLGTILKELDSLGYNARWCVLGAWHVGAPHRRNRMWILAHSNRAPIWKQQRRRTGQDRESQAKPGHNGEKESLANSDSSQCKRMQCTLRVNKEYSNPGRSSWWDTEPRLGRVAHGVADRMDRLKAIGNGQVPAVAANAFRILSSLL